MWALVPRKTQILIIAALAIILAWGMEALLEIIQGERTSTLKFISLVATLISTVLVGVVSAVWQSLWARLPWIGRKTFPDLTGTWEGYLTSTWINPETGQRLPPIPTTIWIRQSLFTTSIKLRTASPRPIQSAVYWRLIRMQAAFGFGTHMITILRRNFVTAVRAMRAWLG
jgi:SMODS-associating 2TM, beta-strand rich effector domain